jgi:uncharacterized membrane protein
MENVVLITFQNLQNTHDGLKKLRDLDELGDIIVYDMVTIHKQDDNRFEIINHEGPETEDLPAQEAIIGSVVGMIAGPIGMAIGMMSGVMTGALDEDDTEDFHDEILKNANNLLRPGDYAIILDVEESGSVIVDSYLNKFGTVIRTNLINEYDKHNQQQWNELEEEIDREEQEFEKATQEDKAAIKEKLDQLKAKRVEKRENLKTRRDKSKERIKEKMDSINTKINTANGQRKERLRAFNKRLRQKFDKWDQEASEVFL